ncbi:MAG: C1 family peptidase [Ignavibacteriales bacterium]|nr:C1 family peptidase [Ignavibacteriales bacterium]
MAQRKSERHTKSKAVKKLRYGWIPDVPDQRDFLYSAVRPTIAIPPHIDLRPTCPTIEDQGNLGSCTGNALAGAIEFLERKNGVPFVDASRLFIYYNERALEGTIKSDAGAMIRDGIKTLKNQGVCSETRWPYIISKFAAKPGAACYKEALKRQITSYHRILTLDDMRTCLADGFPFVFGFTVYESFESQEVARNGIVQMPQPSERSLGGHAVLAVGYNDEERRFIVRNSWGTDWGQKGYFTIPYEYLASRNLADDLWTIRRGEMM